MNCTFFANTAAAGYGGNAGDCGSYHGWVIGVFLRRLGIEQRAAALAAAAPPDYAGTIDAARVRLTSEDRTGMGRLFKAIAVANPKLDILPGFET